MTTNLNNQRWEHVPLEKYQLSREISSPDRSRAGGTIILEEGFLE